MKKNKIKNNTQGVCNTGYDGGKYGRFEKI